MFFSIQVLIIPGLLKPEKKSWVRSLFRVKFAAVPRSFLSLASTDDSWLKIAELLHE